MRLYKHLSTAELTAKRDELTAKLERAASGIASASGAGRSVSYHQELSELRSLLGAVHREIALRNGGHHRPIYLV